MPMRASRSSLLEVNLYELVCVYLSVTFRDQQSQFKHFEFLEYFSALLGWATDDMPMPSVAGGGYELVLAKFGLFNCGLKSVDPFFC